ncbi:MAG: hypothetical protein OT643_08580 [Bacteroidetes bacterium]|nr:hypothetical protein [Bacteroidota bacterium]
MKLITLTTLVLAVFIGCGKQPADPPQLPPYTQEGKNIFACKINGEVFIAEGTIEKNSFDTKGVESSYRFWSNDTLVELESREEYPKKATVYVYFKYTLTKDTFELNQKEKTVGIIYLPVDDYVFADSKFNTDAINKGWVCVHYAEDKILAGSFEFTAMDSRGELVYITEGRFDISNK